MNDDKDIIYNDNRNIYNLKTNPVIGPNGEIIEPAKYLDVEPIMNKLGDESELTTEQLKELKAKIRSGIEKTSLPKAKVMEDKEKNLMFEKVRKIAVKELGLPEDTDWEEIEQARLNRDDLRLSYANKLGLPENTTWIEIDFAVDAELRRRDRIKALNLPKDYTLEQIYQVESKIESEMMKAKMIAKLGLPENATWEQIDQAHNEAIIMKIENRNSGMHK